MLYCHSCGAPLNENGCPYCGTRNNRENNERSRKRREWDVVNNVIYINSEQEYYDMQRDPGFVYFDNVNLAVDARFIGMYNGIYMVAYGKDYYKFLKNMKLERDTKEQQAEEEKERMWEMMMNS